MPSPLYIKAIEDSLLLPGPIRNSILSGCRTRVWTQRLISFPVSHLTQCLAQCYIHIWCFKNITWRQQSESHSVMSDSLRRHGLYSSWNSLGQNTGVGSLSLLPWRRREGKGYPLQDTIRTHKILFQSFRSKLYILLSSLRLHFAYFVL